MSHTYVMDHMRSSLASHVLEVHVDTPKLKGWYLRPAKGGRMMSTLILATVEGLVILGDLCPSRNGVISALGYGVDWFGGRLSEGYLCSKFLHRVWVPEVGERQLRERITSARRWDSITKDAARDAFHDIRDAVRDGCLTAECAYRIHDEAGLSDFEDLGHDYEPGEAGWLCAIQQRFADLYRVATQSEAA